MPKAALITNLCSERRFSFHGETHYVDQHRTSIFTLEDTLPLILPNPFPFGLLSSQSVLNQT